MDREFVTAFKELTGQSGTVFHVGYDTFLAHDLGTTTIRYEGSGKGIFEHRLRPLDELYEGDSPFSWSDSDDDWNDRYMPLLSAIESAINRIYRKRRGMKDKQAINVMNRLVARPEMRPGGELSLAIQDHLRICLSTEAYSRKEVVGALRKVLKSAKRHHGVSGPRGYLEFIKDMV